MARIRSYISNISKTWPLERQAAVLTGKGVLYKDVLRKAKLADYSPDMLEQRGHMLRQTTRTEPETIYVASLVCLALTLPDLCDVLAAASQRPATVIALDTGLEIPPSDNFDLFGKVAQVFQLAKRRGAMIEGQTKGWIKAVENRNADTKQRLALIVDDWKRGDHKTAELLVRAGRGGKPMARNTAYHHLGDRKKEQKKWNDHQAYLARKEAIQ